MDEPRYFIESDSQSLASLMPAGEKHLHGATPDSDFSHIFITGPDNKTTQIEE
jgi:quercetin dioxygenase-like cupin family protein